MLYVTSGSVPTGTTGAFADRNKLDAPANVLGASGLLQTQMTNAKVKVAYDFTKTLRGAYTFGYWSNDAQSGTETYLRRDGNQTLGGQAGFATGTYDLDQRHNAHSLSLRSRSIGNWNVEAAATLYDYAKDQQRFPTTTTAADTFATAGRAAVMDGTGWTTLDLKGAWHRGGPGAKHEVTFGVHHDRYVLDNTTYNTPRWRDDELGSVFTAGRGKTELRALWVQDRWRLTDVLNFSIGGRQEMWRAYDGFNQSGSTQVVQREVKASRFSPKAILAWNPTQRYTLTASLGQAFRFPTAAELYQIVSTGATFTSPDPNLKPDNVIAAELRAEAQGSAGFARLVVFQDEVRDAIVSQFRPLVPDSPTLYQFVSNVDRVRARGAEVALGVRDIGIRNLEVSGNVTYLSAKVLEIDGAASASGTANAAVGKYMPNIPKWRVTLLNTYRPTESLALSLAGRYSSKLYTTLDNADVRFNTYQGFSEWFVMDARANYRLNHHWSGSIGVDNLLDRKYFLFHPFPQRTVVGSVKYQL